MKLSIVIEAREDFELILPLLKKIDKIQKDGKYLFYRLVCICKHHEEIDFKICLEKHKVNVPYSFWEKESDGTVVQDMSVPHFFAEDLFRYPADMVLFLRKSDITNICSEKAVQLKLAVGLIDLSGEPYVGHIPIELTYTTETEKWYKSIVSDIIARFKL